MVRLLENENLTKRKKQNIWSISTGLSIGLTIFNIYFLNLRQTPWKLETAIHMFAFAISGYFFYYNIGRWEKSYLLLSFGIICLAIGAASGIYWNSNVDYLSVNYGNLLIFYLSSVTSIVGICVSCMFIKGTSFFTYVGQHTLAILLMHKFPVLFFQTVFPITKRLLAEGSDLIGVVVSIVSIVLCLIAERIIVKFLPFIVGKSSSIRATVM